LNAPDLECLSYFAIPQAVSDEPDTTTTLPAGSQNVACTTTLAATVGTTPYTWSIFSGTLPAGLILAPGAGVISGTPTVAGVSARWRWRTSQRLALRFKQ
jgi:hypothetical protein